MPQVIPSHEELISRARAVAAEVSRYAEQSEHDRCLHPEAELAMRKAGLYRVAAPRKFGGYEAGPRALSEAITTIARVYPSAGWVFAVYITHTWMAAMFPEEGQAEVFAGDPDARIAGGLAPQGVAEPVEGGWRVNGRWQFGSGIMGANWYLAGTTVTSPVKGTPRQVHVLVPRNEVIVEDTWYTLGLRGTGSHDVVLKDVFVPERRAIPSGTLFRGESPHARRHATNFYLMPLTPTLALVLGSALLGMAQRGLELFVEQMAVSTAPYTKEAKAEKPGVQMRLAEADAEIYTAELLLHDVVRRFEELVVSGADADVAFRASAKWHIVHSVQLCRRAAERLYDAAGARATFDTSELQRVFRDINQGAHHATIDPEGAAQIHGRVKLGLPPGSYLI